MDFLVSLDPRDVVEEPGYSETPDMRGYVVVDMLPPPALCSGVADLIAVGAAWRRADDGWQVQLDFGKPQLGEFDGSAAPGSIDGQVMSTSMTPSGGLTIHWRPDRPEQIFGSLMVPATARGVRQSVGIELTLAPLAERRENLGVPTKLFDTCR